MPSSDKLLSWHASITCLLFSDEVYRFLEQRAEDTLPAACDLYENAVSLGVMSKTYGLAGLRIGWVATRNQDIHAAMAAFKYYTSICNSGPLRILGDISTATQRNNHPTQPNYCPSKYTNA